jgi:cardiolipin synthase
VNVLESGISKLVRRAVKPALEPRAAIVRAVRPVAETTTKDVLTRTERTIMRHATTRNQVTLHVSSEASHQALLESIRTAKASFLIETFIWHDDQAGNEVIQALGKRVRDAKAKGEKFDAKVLLDWFGINSGGAFGDGTRPDLGVIEKLRKAGVEVLEFSKGYINGGALVPITHRKLYIQDGTKFITGGRNIGDEYLKKTYMNPLKVQENAWHDLMFTVEGEETARILEEFYRNWERAGGTAPKVLPPAFGHKTGRAKVEAFVTNPHEGIYDLERAHLGMIANAEKEIVMIYPYFFDQKLIAALREAKRKNPGLAVKVILPANKEVSAEGGFYSASVMNRETARQLMKEGIQVRMYGGGDLERFSHFKGMVVDRKVLSLGSANGDRRTLSGNHELNTLIADTKVAKDFLDQVVNPDWASATPLTQADLAKDGWKTRVRQWVLKQVSFLL